MTASKGIYGARKVCLRHEYNVLYSKSPTWRRSWFVTLIPHRLFVINAITKHYKKTVSQYTKLLSVLPCLSFRLDLTSL